MQACGLWHAGVPSGFANGECGAGIGIGMGAGRGGHAQWGPAAIRRASGGGRNLPTTCYERFSLFLN